MGEEEQEGNDVRRVGSGRTGHAVVHNVTIGAVMLARCRPTEDTVIQVQARQENRTMARSGQARWRILTTYTLYNSTQKQFSQ
jgi:hypothetical protein